MISNRHRVAAAIFLFTLGMVHDAASQILETETARLLRKGAFAMSSGFEFQTSSEGTESAVPFAFEYGLRDNLEFLVEPVPYAAIRPKLGPQATGPGDLEATLNYRFRQETGSMPALAAGLEVKFPTAHNSLIGTGEEDYAGYLIASKQLGSIDTHVNISYTWVGKSEGVNLNDIVGFGVAGEYRASASTMLFGEVFGNTATTPEADKSSTAVVPEAAGGELVGTLGAGRYVSQNALLFLAISYDNNNAVLFHPGFTFQFR